jgi:hypothetical protein
MVHPRTKKVFLRTDLLDRIGNLTIPQGNGIEAIPIPFLMKLFIYIIEALFI